MCDTLLATGPHTASGRMLFGKNSDRKAEECQPFRRLSEAFHREGAELRCTHIRIPQIERTHAVMGHSPWWVWGFEHGVNQHALAIGNLAVFSREAPEETPGLIGMDLVRLGLERARDAREALRVITSRLEAHGQGGSAFAPDAAGYHNSFMIADPREAWVLETSGRRWAAKQVELASLSNHISLGSDWDEASQDLEAFARDEGWWDGGEDEKEGGSASPARIHLAKAYRNPFVPAVLSDGRQCRSGELLTRTSGQHDRQSFLRILRDHGEGCAVPPADATPEEERFFTLCVHHDPPGPTTASLVAELPADPRMPWPVWISFAVPCGGVFIPVYIEGAIPAVLAKGSDAQEDDSAWWIFQRLQQAASVDLEKSLPLLRQEWRAFEEEIEDQRVAAEREAAERIEAGDRDGATRLLSDFMERIVREATQRATALTRMLRADRAG
jgi:secernin